MVIIILIPNIKQQQKQKQISNRDIDNKNSNRNKNNNNTNSDKINLQETTTKSTFLQTRVTKTSYSSDNGESGIGWS